MVSIVKCTATRARAARPSVARRLGCSASASSAAASADGSRGGTSRPTSSVTISGVPPTDGGHHRHAGGHRLENRERDALADRTVHEHIQARQIRTRVVAVPKKVYRVFQPPRARFAFEPVAIRPVSDYQHMHPATTADQLRRRLDERLKMFDRIETRDGADQQRVIWYRQSPAQVGAGVGCGLRAQLDAVVDDLNPVLGQALGDHMPFEVMRHRRDTAGCTREDGVQEAALARGRGIREPPCSVNTTRRPGRVKAGQGAVHKGRVLMAVEHVRIDLSRDRRETSRQRRVEARLAPERGHRRARGFERLAPRAGVLEATDGLPRLVPKSLDQFNHEPFGAARVEREDDLEDRRRHRDSYGVTLRFPRIPRPVDSRVWHASPLPRRGRRLAPGRHPRPGARQSRRVP